MGVKEVLDAARGKLATLISRLPRGGRGRRSSAQATRYPASFGVSDDALSADASAESGFSGAETASDDGFPGFAPAPGLKDRFLGGLDSTVNKVRDNPRVIAAAAGGLLMVLLLAMAAALVFRPPRPVTAPSFSDTEALEILRLIPIPLVDPLKEDSPLDRPRKARYTESEIAGRWLDLGLLPAEGLREKNQAELRAILSAREKP